MNKQYENAYRVAERLREIARIEAKENVTTNITLWEDGDFRVAVRFNPPYIDDSYLGVIRYKDSVGKTYVEVWEYIDLESWEVLEKCELKDWLGIYNNGEGQLAGGDRSPLG